MANAMTAMGVTTLLFVNMSVSRAASQTAEDLYQVDRLNGGPAWQRQCALSEKDCMRELSQVALQLAFDLAGESAGTSPRCSEKLQAAINSSCGVCVSPVCSAGGSVPVIGLEHHQMLQGFFSPEQNQSLQVIGPTFDWPTPQRTTRARAEERGCSFHRCRTKFKTSSYFTVSDCSGKPKRKIAVPLTRDWALSSLPDSTACVPEACKKRPNGLFRIVECVNNLWVPTAAYLLQRTWSGTENCSAADSLQQHGLRLLDAIMAGVCLPEIDFDATTASGSTIVDASSGQQVNASMRSSFRRYDCSAGELRSGCKAGCDECESTRRLSRAQLLGGAQCTPLVGQSASMDERPYNLDKCNWFCPCIPLACSTSCKLVLVSVGASLARDGSPMITWFMCVQCMGLAPL